MAHYLQVRGAFGHGSDANFSFVQNFHAKITANVPEGLKICLHYGNLSQFQGSNAGVQGNAPQFIVLENQ